MPLPLRFRQAGQRGTVSVELTVEGLGFRGDTAPRVDLLVHVWDALVVALALGEIDLAGYLGAKEAERRVSEARAALQAHLRGRGADAQTRRPQDAAMQPPSKSRRR